LVSVTEIGGRRMPELCFLPGRLRWTILPKERYGESLSGRGSNTQPSNCEADIYQWSFAAPPILFSLMTAINCGPPVPIANTTRAVSDTTYQRTAVYTCQKGMWMMGTKVTSATTKCAVSGLWLAGFGLHWCWRSCLVFMGVGRGG